MAGKNILESIIDYIKPKAHDAIDAVTQQWEESKSSPIAQLSPDVESLIQSLVMGRLGGGGKNILSKIKSRNALARRNLKPGAPVTGQQTLKPKDAEWLENQMKDAEWLKNQMNKWEGLRGEKVFPSSGRPENLLNTMMLTLASPLIAKNLVDVGYGQLEGEPLNIGMPAKRK